MKYEDLDFKIPIESKEYCKDSEFIINNINNILEKRKIDNTNKIIINTNLKFGLPLENINKIAGPIIEAWAYEVFSIVNNNINNSYNLINVEAQKRTAISDILLQFKKRNKSISGNIDVKATAEDIKNSGKSPNITSYARIRTEYIKDPDFIFIILSLKHKLYSKKNEKTNYIDNFLEIVDYNVYDFKYLSKNDISYNPALGNGQIQIKDIHSVSCEYRTTWEMCKLLDEKYLNSSNRTFDDFLKLARKKKWIKN